MGKINVDYDVLNQKGSPAWYSDLFANIPTPGYTGRMFISTDTFAFYRDNGTGWDLTGGPGIGTITGSGVSGQVSFFSGTQVLGGSTNLIWDNTNNRLGIGVASPTVTLEISGSVKATALVKSGGTSAQILLADGTTTPTSTFQAAITLTTTGTTGASTLVGATLNVPTYTFVSSVSALTLGTSGTDLTSSVANSTTTPTITLNVPTASATNRGALSSADWTTFNNKQATITLTTTGTSGAATLVGATLNVPNYTNVGTVTSVAALTLGTTGTDLSSSVANSTSTPVITLNVPTASASNRGALSSTDWTTFNNKQATLSLTTTGTSGVATLVANTLNVPNYGSGAVSGSGTTNYIPKFTAASTIGNSIIQESSSKIGIGVSPSYTLEVNGVVAAKSTGNGGRFESIDSNVGGANITLNPALFTTGEPAIQTQTNSPILFAPNTIEKMRITTAGTVLVNAITSTYGAALGYNFGVKGTSGQSYISIARTGQSLDSQGMILGLDTAAGQLTMIDNLPLLFNTNSSLRLTLASTGAATFTNSVTAVGLYSSTTASGNLAASVINNVTSASGSTGYGLLIESEASAATSYALTVRNLASTNTYFHISTETGRVGYIGMGITAPTSLLQIAVSNAVVDATKGVKITNTVGTIVMLECGNSSDSYVGTLSASDFHIKSNNINRISVNSSGNVGIGTTSPSDKLDVQGSSGVGIRVSNSTNPGYNANLVVNFNDVSTMQLNCLGTTILQSGNTGNTVLASRTTIINVTAITNFTSRGNYLGATDNALFSLNSGGTLYTVGFSPTATASSTNTFTITNGTTTWIYTGSGAATWTLPNPSGNNQIYWIKNAGTGAITLTAFSGTNIINNSAASVSTISIAVGATAVIAQDGNVKSYQLQ